MRKFCAAHKDFYIKVDNEFRGISESFKHHDKHSSESRIDYIAYKVGPYKEDVVFICEELLHGVEPGIDAITWDGELLFPATAGYESKGSGIISRVYRHESELPEALRTVHAGLAPEFRRHKTRFFYSAEFKIDIRPGSIPDRPDDPPGSTRGRSDTVRAYRKLFGSRLRHGDGPEGAPGHQAQVRLCRLPRFVGGCKDLCQHLLSEGDAALGEAAHGRQARGRLLLGTAL